MDKEQDMSEKTAGRKATDLEFPCRIFYRNTTFNDVATAYAAARIDMKAPEAKEEIDRISKMTPEEAAEHVKGIKPSPEFEKYGDRILKALEIQKFSEPRMFKALSDHYDSVPERYQEIQKEVAKTVPLNEISARLDHRIRFYVSAFGSRSGGYSKESGELPLPDEAKKRMADVIRTYTDFGAWIRSGGADGMDTVARDAADGRITEYLPMNEYNERTAGNGNAVKANSTRQTKAAVAALHPNPQSLKAYDEDGKEKWSLKERLVERNWQIIHGQDGPAYRSLFAVCWTPGGKEDGGSGQTMRNARVSISKGDLGVPVFNLANDEDYRLLMEQLPAEIRSKFAEKKFRKDDIAECPTLKKRLSERTEIFVLNRDRPEESTRWLKKNGKWEKADRLHDEIDKKPSSRKTDLYRKMNRSSGPKSYQEIPF